jgi:hypothetical protein
MKPNSRFDHAFVILRIDCFQGSETPLEDKVTVTKILFDGDAAEKEVERLNSLHPDSRVRYFSQLARLETIETAELQRPQREVG